MQRRFLETSPTVCKINVTPIIDVALVLVIILLITAPMISTANMEVNLPQALTRSADDEVRVSITFAADGGVAIDDEVIERAALTRVLGAKLREIDRDNILVIVRADAGVPYPWVRDIIDDAKMAGAGRIAIATRQRGKDV